LLHGGLCDDGSSRPQNTSSRAVVYQATNTLWIYIQANVSTRYMTINRLFSPRNRSTTGNTHHDRRGPLPPTRLQHQAFPHELLLPDHQRKVASSFRFASIPSSPPPPPPPPGPIWINDRQQQWPFTKIAPISSMSEERPPPQQQQKHDPRPVAGTYTAGRVHHHQQLQQQYATSVDDLFNSASSLLLLDHMWDTEND
jgi:hypothetical protein